MWIITSAAILAPREQDGPVHDEPNGSSFGRERSMKKRINTSMKQARGRFGAPRMHA